MPSHVTPEELEVAAAAARARTDGGIAEVAGRAFAWVTGADRVKYLNGQCSQDVRACAPGKAMQAFVLDARGRNFGCLDIITRDHDLLLGADAAIADDLWKRLRQFIIAEDVAITPIDARAFVIWGDGAAETIAGAAAETHAAVAVDDYGFPATCLVASGPVEPRGVCARVAPEVIELIRIEAGHPRFHPDLGADVLPGESGQEERTVSYTKGCYAGQEVVARQKYLGKPRRMLVGISWNGTSCDAGTRVFNAAGADVGRLGSTAWSATVGARIGLAIIAADSSAASTALMLRTAGGASAACEVRCLPFVGS